MRLSGKKALVTGGSRGIGKAIALAYGKEGADVAITGRSYETLKPVLDEIRSMGQNAEGFEWDVSKVQQADEQIAKIAGKLGGLDIVLNNAGVISHEGFLEVTEEKWDMVMGINLKGLYFVAQAAANFMVKESKAGKIINIASDAGLRPEWTPYGISKWGVVALTKGFAKMLATHNILVNAIAPGPVATNMMGWKPGDPIERKGLPLGRLARPEEIGDAAVFLASDESSHVNGDILVVNGGLGL